MIYFRPGSRTGCVASCTDLRSWFADLWEARCALVELATGCDVPWKLRSGLNNLFIFSKLKEARSRLYRRQILQVQTRLKALEEIYKIYTYASFGEKNRS